MAFACGSKNDRICSNIKVTYGVYLTRLLPVGVQLKKVADKSDLASILARLPDQLHLLKYH